METYLREGSARQKKPRQVLSVLARLPPLPDDRTRNIDSSNSPTPSTIRFRNTFVFRTPFALVVNSPSPRILERQRHRRRRRPEPHGALYVSRSQRKPKGRVKVKCSQAVAQVYPHRFQDLRCHEQEGAAFCGAQNKTQSKARESMGGGKGQS